MSRFSNGPRVHRHSQRRLARFLRGVCGVRLSGLLGPAIPSIKATARTCLSAFECLRFFRLMGDDVVFPKPVSGSSSEVLVSEGHPLAFESESSSDEVTSGCWG